VGLRQVRIDLLELGVADAELPAESVGTLAGTPAVPELLPGRVADLQRDPDVEGLAKCGPAVRADLPCSLV
jgi:hypothetical protein